MLRIAIQSKGRLYEESMALLEEAGIKLPGGKRTLLVSARNFPVEVLFLRDDDIPESVASGVADVGIVGLNEVLEKRCPVGVLRKLGFGRCRLSLAIPQDMDYPGLGWFSGRKIATSYPGILSDFLHRNGIEADIHVIAGSVEIAPGIRLADAIFDIVSSGSTLVSNRLKEVEQVVESEAVLIGSDSLSDEKQEILDELLFRFESVQAADGVGRCACRVAGHQEPHGHAFGRSGLVLGAYGTRREPLLGDDKPFEGRRCRRYRGARY